MRHAAIDALNVWYEVPERSAKHIRSVLHGLHTSSLMLDDIEDDSPLRRGKPATHCVFGAAQTINSANFQFVEMLDVVRRELGSECLGIYAEELRLLHIGQSLDLHWTSRIRCPSMAEYLKMIDCSEFDSTFAKLKVTATNRKSRNRRAFQNHIPNVGRKVCSESVSQKAYLHCPDPASFVNNADLSPIDVPKSTPSRPSSAATSKFATITKTSCHPMYGTSLSNLILHL
jgi:hypothetical protein